MKGLVRRLLKKEKAVLRYSIIILVLLGLIFLMFNLVKAIAFMFLFIFVNIMIRFYRRILTGIPIEFEVIIFGGVLTTIAFGMWAGLIVVLFASVLGEFLNQSISPNYLVNIICYIFVPIISLLLTAQSVVLGGLVLMIVINVIIFVIFVYMGYDLFKNIGYAVTNVALNYLLFAYLAEPLLRIMMMK